MASPKFRYSRYLSKFSFPLIPSSNCPVVRYSPVHKDIPNHFPNSFIPFSEHPSMTNLLSSELIRRHQDSRYLGLRVHLTPFVDGDRRILGHQGRIILKRK